LVTNTPDSTTGKMKMAEELGVKIMTYEKLAELFNLDKDE